MGVRLAWRRCTTPGCRRWSKHRLCCRVCGRDGRVSRLHADHSDDCRENQARHRATVTPPRRRAARHVRVVDTPPPRPTTPRLCLRCERVFASDGPANRLCQDCRSFLAHSPPELPRGRIAGLREQTDASP